MARLQYSINEWEPGKRNRLTLIKTFIKKTKQASPVTWWGTDAASLGFKEED